MTQRDWQKDMDLVQSTIKYDAFPAWTEPMLYWLEEVKRLESRANAAEERERRLIKAYTGRVAPVPKEKGAPVNVD